MSLKIGQLQIARRDRLCIIAEMLRVAKEEACKQKIMQQANLSSSQFNRYIHTMLSSHLVARTLKDKRFSYRTTEKGLYFLRVHGEVMNLFGRRDPQLVMPYVH